MKDQCNSCGCSNSCESGCGCLPAPQPRYYDDRGGYGCGGSAYWKKMHELQAIADRIPTHCFPADPNDPGHSHWDDGGCGGWHWCRCCCQPLPQPRYGGCDCGGCQPHDCGCRHDDCGCHHSCGDYPVPW